MSMWLLLNVIAAAGVGITVYAFAAAVVGPWEGPPTSRPEGLTPAPPTPAPCESFRFREGAPAFFGADNDTAVGAAILLHAISFVPVVLAGLWFTIQDGLRLGGIAQMTAKGDLG